jgi:hypothetical protein
MKGTGGRWVRLGAGGLKPILSNVSDLTELPEWVVIFNSFCCMGSAYLPARHRFFMGMQSLLPMINAC